jgi:hypothetical protein
VVHRGFIAPRVEGAVRPGSLRELHIDMSRRSQDLQIELQQARGRVGHEDWPDVERLEALVLELSEWLLWIERRLPTPGAEDGDGFGDVAGERM